MNPPDPTLMLALVVALVLMLPLMAAWRRRGPRSTPRRAPDSAMSDRFEPQAVRVMTTAERQAHALLQKALPNAMVLAQVPFTRFLKVNGSQQIWLQQAAGLSADLLLCDACTRVLAVVDVRSARISEGSRKRHERKARLLKAAGIRLLCWQEDALPDVAMIRSQLAASHPTSTATATPSQPSTISRPAPLIPVAEALEMADDDYAEGAMEPVPSALFDELAPDLPLPSRR